MLICVSIVTADRAEVVTMTCVPPSGVWSGFYLQHKEKHQFDMKLTFHEGSHAVLGTCQDGVNDLGLDFADIRGTWDMVEEGEECLKISLTKLYRGKHSVDYTGFCYLNNIHIISGYYFDSPDLYFEMRHKDVREEQSATKEALVTKMFENISLNYIKDEQQFFDFTIECSDNQEVRAHKFILAAQSKFFQGFFRRESKDSLRLPFESEPVRGCVSFLYTATCELEEASVQPLLEVANYLGVLPLVDSCAAFLAARTDEDNLAEMAALASAIGSPVLEAATATYLLDHPHLLSDPRHRDRLLQVD